MPDPLHPAVVHFPVALAALIPFLALLAAVAIATGRGGRALWAGVVVLQLLLALSAFAAAQTGEREEDRVEQVVGHDVLHDHEEAGERLVWLAALTAPLAALGLAPRRLGRAGRAFFVAVAFAMLIPTYLVGRSGGELVYEHGAASAYGPGEPAASTSPD